MDKVNIVFIKNKLMQIITFSSIHSKKCMRSTATKFTSFYNQATIWQQISNTSNNYITTLNKCSRDGIKIPTNLEYRQGQIFSLILYSLIEKILNHESWFSLRTSICIQLTKSRSLKKKYNLAMKHFKPWQSL